MKNSTFLNKIRTLLISLAFAVFLFTGGCYFFDSVIQPETVFQNTPFKVKINIKADYSYEPSLFTPAYGYLGILLPTGWKVNDSIFYSFADGKIVKDWVLIHNTEAEQFVKNFNGLLPPSGYYWWVAKSKYQIDLNLYEITTATVTITPNNKTGNYKMKYIVGDDNEWNVGIGDIFCIALETDYMQVELKSGVTGNREQLVKSGALEVYPNPATDKVVIKWNQNPEQLHLKLYQVSGTCVLDKIITSGEEISVTALQPGMYLYQLADQNNVLQSGKLLKE